MLDGYALYTASEEGYEAIVNLMVDKGANVNAQGRYHRNAPQAASGESHTAIAKLLVERALFHLTRPQKPLNIIIDWSSLSVL